MSASDPNEGPVGIQILSDLHLEVERVGAGQPGLYEYEFPARAENLAILGDLGSTNDDRFFDWLEVQLSRFRRVFFVPGNHEPYRTSLEQSNARLAEFATREVCPGEGEFIFLAQTRYDLSPTITILGCTLWSSLSPEALEVLSWSLTDFRRIESFSPSKYNRLHSEDIAWLNETVHGIRTEEKDRRVAIFTHHSPTIDGTSDPKYVDGPTNSAFATELSAEPCWGPPVTVWAFGHTHWTCDFVKDGVRVISNQRGYGLTAPKYDPEKVVEL